MKKIYPLYAKLRYRYNKFIRWIGIKEKKQLEVVVLFVNNKNDFPATVDLFNVADAVVSRDNGIDIRSLMAWDDRKPTDKYYHDYKYFLLRMIRHQFNGIKIRVQKVDEFMYNEEYCMRRIAANITGAIYQRPINLKIKHGQFMKSILDEDVKYTMNVNSYFQCEIPANTYMVFTFYGYIQMDKNTK